MKKEFEDGLLRKGDIYKEFGEGAINKVQIKLVGEIESKTGTEVNALNYLSYKLFSQIFFIIRPYVKQQYCLKKR